MVHVLGFVLQIEITSDTDAEVVYNPLGGFIGCPVPLARVPTVITKRHKPNTN